MDVEPVVFWDGREPSPADVLGAWRTAVGFDDDRHGVVSVGKNGPSGDGLTTQILQPLGFVADTVAFTDAWPSFFVKHGANSQGAAIRDRYNPVAIQLGLPQSTLPTRPTTRQLVDLVTSTERRNTLRDEIIAVGAPLVITLGQEALDAVRGIADSCAGVQTMLAPTNDYGHSGVLTIAGRAFELLPLAHPGFIRQTRDPAWTAALSRWQDAFR